MAYHLNPSLAEWAYRLTKDIQLDDFPSMAKYRAQYDGYPNAQKPPFILKGENVSAGTFGFGKILNQWANDWVKLWSNSSNFVSSAEEDTGILQSLTNLAKAGKVDINRVLVLRTASDYTLPAPNKDVATLVNEAATGNFPGYQSSISSAYKVGSAVIHKILDGWKTYEQTIPGA